MNAPLVSIITPTYNAAAFIDETIRSVLQQTYSNWELLIVDDCSSDNTVAIASAHAANDNRIQIRVLDRNQGPGGARNTAMQMSEGRYIAFLDADDFWMPEKLQKQIDFMQQSKQSFTFCFYDLIDEQGKSLHQRIEAPGVLTYRQLLYCNYVGNLTGIYDTEVFGRIPISTIRKRQDWIIWLTIMKQIRKASPVPESLAKYRVRTESVSSSKIGLLKHNYNIYRNFHHRSALMSVLSMCRFLFEQLLVKPRYKKHIKA